MKLKYVKNKEEFSCTEIISNKNIKYDLSPINKCSNWNDEYEFSSTCKLGYEPIFFHGGQLIFKNDQYKLQKEGKPNLYSSTLLRQRLVLNPHTKTAFIRKCKKISKYFEYGTQIIIKSYPCNVIFTVKTKNQIFTNIQYDLNDNYVKLTNCDVINKLILLLRNNNFLVKIVKSDILDKNEILVYFYGNNIKGNVHSFPSYSEESKWSLNNVITADHYDCFDKTSKCPFKLKINNIKNDEEFLKRLLFWGTEKGYEISNSFDFNHYDDFTLSQFSETILQNENL